MPKLEDRITNIEYYRKEFEKWEASEIIIDDDKAIWTLRFPGSEYRKVSLYRDAYNMHIYGDYGRYSFDKMTWWGSVYNLKYDNLDYQMEKMDRHSRKFVYEFDEEQCEKDLMEWFKEYLEQFFEENGEENYDSKIKLAEEILKDTRYFYSDREIRGLCTSKGLSEDLSGVIGFVMDMKYHIDELDWLPHLRDSNLDEFDEPYESSLLSAGKLIDQSFLISLYALKVCGQKLKRQKEKEGKE